MSPILPFAPGVYQIVCLPTGKRYIGSSNNIGRRQGEHIKTLRRGKHFNLHLQRAWNKYGEVAFTFEALELVMPWAIQDREQYWLNKLKPYGKRGFNASKSSRSGMGGRKLSDEHKARISASMQATLAPRKKPKFEKPPGVSNNRVVYIVTSPAPDNLEIEVNGLLAFCRLHGLSQSGMHNVATGLSRSYKGWKCRFAKSR